MILLSSGQCPVRRGAIEGGVLTRVIGVTAIKMFVLQAFKFDCRFPKLNRLDLFLK